MIQTTEKDDNLTEFRQVFSGSLFDVLAARTLIAPSISFRHLPVPPVVTVFDFARVFGHCQTDLFSSMYRLRPNRLVSCTVGHRALRPSSHPSLPVSRAQFRPSPPGKGHHTGGRFSIVALM